MGNGSVWESDWLIERHTTRCLKPFIMYGVRCAGCKGSQCHSVGGGCGPEVREPALADRWSQGDGERCSYGARGDGEGSRGRWSEYCMQESVGRWV
jgi:hypothetical protein